ncbi:hypothetical protein FRB96_007936 [Tulasnella sp. 330]|nr:hypothetical protein FRB96_007936 [Tulasnella sp. 330]KAG8878871.1 hypothetical protein FRB98_005924 [Tulasnella sp. 332]
MHSTYLAPANQAATMSPQVGYAPSSTAALDTRSRFSVDSDDIVITNGVALDATQKNAGGAPIEETSPMGREIGWWSIVFLNFSSMIGTGIFSTPGTLLKETGSVGLALIYWFIGLLMCLAGYAYYLELAATFPERAGADVAYFEQIYKRPKRHLQQYVLYSRGAVNPNPWEERGIAVLSYALICLCIILSTKWSLRLSNLLSAVKVITLLFIVVTGFVVLGGHTKVVGPGSHFSQPFAGSSSNGNDLANALVNIHFAFSGYTNANSLMNEIGGDKIKKLRSAGAMSITIVFFLYFFANIAYFAAIPIAEAKASGQLIAGVFFTKVFGEYAGTRVLPVLIAISAWGNVLSTSIGQARMLREIARQGVIPFSSFFASTKPFGTPAAPILLKFILTAIVIIGPPAGDAFTFLVSLQSYPSRIFDILLIIGVWILRRRRVRAGLPQASYQAWHIALVFSIFICLFILIMPWVPPKTGRYGGNVSFWYGAAPAAGVGIIVACFIYWYTWARLLPRVFQYTICEEISQGENGELSKKFVRVYNDERGDEFRKQRAEERDTEGELTPERKMSKDVEHS